MLEEKDLKKCHFVPLSTMKKVIELMETRTTGIVQMCKRNLVDMQMYRTNPKILEPIMVSSKTKKYQIACCKAIYSHNWNKLLYLLKKCPPWELLKADHNDSSLYVRALTILLMYYPTSQAKGLFNDYLHMVWSCRSVEDKKAVLKIILTLPEKIHGVTLGRYSRLVDAP